VALWRTSAAVAALLLVATACGHVDSREAASGTTIASRAQLAPIGQQPLTVKGSGFQPNEKVRVSVNGAGAATTAADSSGAFVARLPGVDACDSLTVAANGSAGTHAEFNLSQIVCNGS